MVPFGLHGGHLGGGQKDFWGPYAGSPAWPGCYLGVSSLWEYPELYNPSDASTLVCRPSVNKAEGKKRGREERREGEGRAV